MTEPRRPLIVVGIDETPESQLALRWAVGEALHRGASVRIVRAHTWPPARTIYAGEYFIGEPPPAEMFQEGLDAAVTYARHRLGEEWAVGILKAKIPAGALIEESDGADLLVVGSNPRSTLSAVVLGSVSSAVAAQAPCPVVVVRGGSDNEFDGSETQSAGIVVGVDGSELSDRAVAFAFDQAVARDLPLRLIHCWQPADHIDPAYWDEERLAAHVEEHRVRLTESTAPYREKYPAVDVTIELVRGRPGPILVRKSTLADMLVVGSRGHGGVAGLLLGSVSQNVLHHAHCTVVVVRQKLPKPASQQAGSSVPAAS